MQGMKNVSEVLNNELFMLIGRLYAHSTDREASLIRKASELYALVHNLPALKGASISQRRRKLGLGQEELGELCRVAAVTVANWEKAEGPAWIGPMLDALEERRRDEERRDYLGINDDPET